MTSRDGTRIAVMDENGNGVADRIDDVYLYDNGGDGTIDQVVDWTDLDGDGQPDRQCIFYLTGGNLGPGLTGFVIEHNESGSEFWPTVKGRYAQKSCQYFCDFHGNSFFTAIRWDARGQRWTAFDESPFCFFDPDGDGRSEECLRVSATGRKLRSIRWSFDTDDDARRPVPAPNPDGGFDHPSPKDYSQAYDYDLSLTALGRTSLRSSVLDTLHLRNETTLPLLAWNQAQSWAAAERFNRVFLTFDEDDRNVAPHDSEARDRWEGVIGKSPGRGFPQIGNPHCGNLNKRYELRDGALRPIEVYFSEVDGRVHLKGAARGWIDIDQNYDGVVDHRLETEDRDADGYFDLWLWDAGADGTIDGRHETESRAHDIPLAFSSLREFEARVREETGWKQGERFWNEVEIWNRLGRFVPTDSLRHFGSAED